MIATERDALEDAIEQIFQAGVALTSRALAEAMRAKDLTLPQWRAVRIVGDASNGATLSEVAGGTGVTLPATSRMLHRLERRGLMDIRPDERDRRASRATLTMEGQQLLREILGYRRRAIRETCEELSIAPATVAEIGVLAQALDRYR